MKIVLRRGLLIMFVLGSVLLGSELYTAFSFPAHLRLLPGQEYPMQLGLLLRADSSDDDWPQSMSQRTLRADTVGQTGLNLSLFGVPLRRTRVDVVPRLELIPGGQAVGVVMGTGVTITEVVSVHVPGGEPRAPARDAGLEAGDVIKEIAGQPVTQSIHVERAADYHGRANIPMPMVVERDGQRLNVTVQPIPTFSPTDRVRYVIGVWVKENTAGVGTLTFWDPVTYRYGALGHPIAVDEPHDTAKDDTLGSIVAATILGITPGQRGRPGEKSGMFSERSAALGTIDKNTPFGIYGKLTTAPAALRRPLPVALSHEVETGPAAILTVLDGERVEEFEIAITHVNRQATPHDKGLQVRVTDPRLLQATNGIVQGMSGSPIIQNGRLVGAVTHVFVNDPHRGYGILAEWMAYEAGLRPEGNEGGGQNKLAG